MTNSAPAATLLSILGKHTIEVTRTDANPDEPWYLDWVLQKPKNFSLSITAGYHAYDSLLDVYNPENIGSALEYFGGIGAQSLIIQDLFQPVRHVVADYAEESAEMLRRVLRDTNAYVLRQDAYAEDALDPNADLIGLDFGDLTCWKTREGLPHRLLMDRVFGAYPKGVVLTDVAGPRLGLQRDRYETLLGVGRCGSYRDYLQALCEYLGDIYGYELQAGYYVNRVAKLAFVPEGYRRPTRRAIGEHFPLYPIPAEPVGLEVF